MRAVVTIQNSDDGYVFLKILPGLRNYVLPIGQISNKNQIETFESNIEMFHFQEKPVKLPVIVSVILGLISGADAICTDDECNFELTLNYR